MLVRTSRNNCIFSKSFSYAQRRSTGRRREVPGRKLNMVLLSQNLSDAYSLCDIYNCSERIGDAVAIIHLKQPEFFCMWTEVEVITWVAPMHNLR